MARLLDFSAACSGESTPTRLKKIPNFKFKERFKTMASKKVNVKLHHIFNNSTGDDSGDQLEVYGRFAAERIAFNPDIGELVTLASFNLFDRPSDNAQQLEEGTALIIDSTAQLDIFPGEFLKITGHLVEEDDGFGGSDDGLGGVDIQQFVVR
jgi:hypothetical protein